MSLRARALSIAIAAVLLGPASTARADEPEAECFWRPINDVGAVRGTLERWVAAQQLGPIGMWDLSIEARHGQLDMSLPSGHLVISWDVDGHCSPTAIATRAEGELRAAIPDSSVSRLVDEIRDQERREHRSARPPPIHWGRVLKGVALALGALLAFIGMVLGGRRLVRDAAARARAIRLVRALARNGALVLISMAVAAALAEWPLRWLRVDDRLMTSDFLFQSLDAEVMRESADGFLHYEPAPGAHCDCKYPGTPNYRIHVDENGARFPAHKAQKAQGTFRILCMGGSTTWGAAVHDEETIPAQLERILNDGARDRAGPNHHPVHFEAWNFGLHAYVLSQAAHRARAELDHLAPDLVVVQLHNVGPRGFILAPGADPIDSLRRYSSDPHVLPEYFPPPRFLGPNFHWAALRHSAVYRALTGLYRRFDRSNIDYAEALSRKEARQLAAEAEARGVPVVFYALPGARGTIKASSVDPALPESRFVDLNEPNHDPPFYVVHPPAPYLAELAAALVRRLDERKLLPPNR